MKRSFPQLVVDPGEHLGEWRYGDRVLAGQADLEPYAPPKIHLKGDLRDMTGIGVRGFPETEEIDELRGRLWSGQDIVARDVHLETWYEGRTVAFPRYAVVGLNLGSVPGGVYEEATVQATGLDLLFGRPPLRKMQGPSSDSRHLDGDFVATGDPDSTQEWSDGETTVTCSYWAQQSSPGNPYRFELWFAPVVRVRTAVPLDVDGWLQQWVTPLVRLLALATRQPQELSWFELRHVLPETNGRQWPVRAQVFGSGIAQKAFVSEDADAWRDPNRRPVLSLAGSGLELPGLLRAMRELEDGDNPFIELFRLVMFQRDLPRRAQFLYLVQALEALHGYEHRSEAEGATNEYAARRNAIVEFVVAQGASADDVRFLKDNWPRRGRDDLARRLRALVDGLPPRARTAFDALGGTTLAREVGEPDVESAVRRIRNDLAHGNRNYSERDLHRWTLVLDALCRSHLLRLLGCPEAIIEQPLAIPEER